MNEVTLRAWWWHRQGLDGSLMGKSAAEVLQRCGWSRSVGGVGPYLTLFARAGIDRAAVDAAVAKREIHELPAARGCTYVVPAIDFAVALLAGQGFGQQEMKQALKLGVTEREIDALCAAVLQALSKGPLPPDEIRAATGKAARSLGDEGKKKGLTTTLPLALGRLQEQGEIRRVSTIGRLDNQRYSYALWKPNPLTKTKLDAAQARTAMARGFFSSVGPATLDEFAWFAGLGKRAVPDVVAPLALVPASKGSARLLLPEDVDAWQACKSPRKAQYALVSSLDPISANRRDVASLLDAADQQHPIFGEQRTAGAALADLPSHAILDRGRIVGLWEFDPERAEIVAMTFVPRDKALDAAIRTTETFVREQLGDARSFSLDSPKSRMPRLAALRQQAARASTA